MKWVQTFDNSWSKHTLGGFFHMQEYRNKVLQKIWEMSNQKTELLSLPEFALANPSA